MSSGTDTYRFLLAWVVVLMLAGLAARTRVGYTTLWYLLVLMLVFLLVTQYRWFANVVRPITG